MLFTEKIQVDYRQIIKIDESLERWTKIKSIYKINCTSISLQQREKVILK